MRSTIFLAVCVALAVCSAGRVRAQGDDPAMPGDPDIALPVPPPPGVILKMAGPRRTVPVPVAATPPASASAPAAKTDAAVITNIHGENLRCKILSIEPDGRVRFTASWLKGESCADLGVLRRIKFKSAGISGGKDVVITVNGDIIEGTLTSLTTDTVTIESVLMGTLKVPRGVVRRIERSGGSSCLAGKDFSDGDLGAWKACGGTWKVSDGSMHCTQMHQDHGIAMPVQQKGSMTYEFKMSAIMPYNMQYQVFLYADSVKNNGNPQNYIRFRFNRDSFEIRMCDQKRGTEYLGQYSHRAMANNRNNEPPKGTIRIACDVEKKFITVWINGNQVAKRAMPRVPQAGKFLILRNQYGERTQYVRVYKGVVPPPNKDSGDAEKDTHMMVLSNGDRFRSPTLTLADGKFMVRVAGAEIPILLDLVTYVTMPTGSQVAPRRRKGDTRVRTGRGVVTLQITGLKDGFLTGKSDYLGAVKLAGKAIQRIELNIYAAPNGTSHSGSSSGGPAAVHRAVEMRLNGMQMQMNGLHFQGGVQMFAE